MSLKRCDSSSFVVAVARFQNRRRPGWTSKDPEETGVTPITVHVGAPGSKATEHYAWVRALSIGH